MSRNRTIRWIPLALILVLALSVAGCSKPQAEQPATLPEGHPPTDTPAPISTEPILGETTLGAPGIAGAWTLTIASVEVGESFGGLQSDGGGKLMKLEIVLVNNSSKSEVVQSTDFTITDGESYAPAIPGDSQYPGGADVLVGKMTVVEPVFYVPNNMEPTDLEFVFQHIGAAGITKIKSTLK